MPILLDTVALSELRKKSNADRSVRAWQTEQGGELAYVSVMTMNEIRYGTKKVTLRDPGFGARLEVWYGEILAAPLLYSILPIHLGIAAAAADFRAQLGLSYNDSFIAATAHVHDLTLATRNVADFQTTGIKLVNPWLFGE